MQSCEGSASPLGEQLLGLVSSSIMLIFLVTMTNQLGQFTNVKSGIGKQA